MVLMLNLTSVAANDQSSRSGSASGNVFFLQSHFRSRGRLFAVWERVLMKQVGYTSVGYDFSRGFTYLDTSDSASITGK